MAVLPSRLGEPMKRRAFFTLLGGVALTRPRSLDAQQRPMPVIGWLSARSPEDTVHLLAAFRQGLGQTGYTEGQNVTIEYRWASGEYGRLPTISTVVVLPCGPGHWMTWSVAHQDALTTAARRRIPVLISGSVSDA